MQLSIVVFVAPLFHPANAKTLNCFKRRKENKKVRRQDFLIPWYFWFPSTSVVVHKPPGRWKIQSSLRTRVYRGVLCNLLFAWPKTLLLRPYYFLFHFLFAKILMLIFNALPHNFACLFFNSSVRRRLLCERRLRSK